MIEQVEATHSHNNGAIIAASAGITIALIAVVIAIGAVITARNAVETADSADRRAELAIERQRRMAGSPDRSEQSGDPRILFLVSTADRSDQLDEGLEQWESFYRRYEGHGPEIQYRAYTDFFDAYPITEQYFFFISREETRRNVELPLSSSDRDAYEAFRAWLNLRQSISG